MQLFYLTTKSLLISLGMLYCQTTVSAQTINLQKARTEIESVVAQFSKDYYNGDSAAVAACYTSDGQLGSLTGKEILFAWGRSIRNAVANNNRRLLFTIISLTGDDEFLIDYGLYEIKDDQNKVKSKGKYVVVWKQENGVWKIYRDNGLS